MAAYANPSLSPRSLSLMTLKCSSLLSSLTVSQKAFPDPAPNLTEPVWNRLSRKTMNKTALTVAKGFKGQADIYTMCWHGFLVIGQMWDKGGWRMIKEAEYIPQMHFYWGNCGHFNAKVVCNTGLVKHIFHAQSLYYCCHFRCEEQKYNRKDCNSHRRM